MSEELGGIEKLIAVMASVAIFHLYHRGYIMQYAKDVHLYVKARNAIDYHSMMGGASNLRTLIESLPLLPCMNHMVRWMEMYWDSQNV